MTTFDDRDKAFENKYAHDEEMKFKATARRNKLLGLWAAEKMGITGDKAAEYAKEVVIADFEAPGDDDVVSKVFADLEKAGIHTTERDIRVEMERLFSVAKEQLMTE